MSCSRQCYSWYVALLELHIDGYQIVSIPYDEKTKRTLGYAFIAVRSNEVLLKLYNCVGKRTFVYNRCITIYILVVLIKFAAFVNLS